MWSRFGDVKNYVEPFFGSGAVLLARPQVGSIETINDLDGFVANFWRSIKLSPGLTAEYADQPVNENDLHARHVWLVQRMDSLRSQLEGDPDWHDPKIAGFWVWGLACWIAGGFCSGKGPWWPNEEGQLVRIGDSGRGVKRQRVHLNHNGQGVNRKLVHLGDNGQGVLQSRLLPWFNALAERLRRVRVCSGDWSRVVSPTVTFKQGVTGVFLDPPYADTANRDSDLYREDSLEVAHSVCDWAVANGDNPQLRIALCGYEGEHEMPPAWSVHSWDAGAGFGAQAVERSGNGERERIWFSPACEASRQGSLFELIKEEEAS